jgi:hypothetical protein
VTIFLSDVIERARSRDDGKKGNSAKDLKEATPFRLFIRASWRECLGWLISTR